jgi:DsbC/DsbD-like thiol-disulfide interchange protein
MPDEVVNSAEWQILIEDLMNRRSLLQLAFAPVFANTCYAATPPWSARLLKGGFDGTAWNAGLAITLTEHWKTYWRVPGDGGIAPALNIVGDNIKQSSISYPIPTRFRDAAGMTIGYKNEVVFLLALEPVDPTKVATMSLKSFFGVCDVVCIPAQFTGDVVFDPAQADAPDQILLSDWKKRVPVMKPQGVSEPAHEPIISATVKREGDTLILSLELAEAVNDIFVEGDPKHYFGEPTLTRGQAMLTVSGAKSVDELRATRLRITIVTANAALEQMLNVS